MNTRNRGEGQRMRTIEQRVAEFERTYQRKELAGWRYDTVGDGAQEDAVLLLPGRVGIGISWVDLALALRPGHRTVTVDYPPTAHRQRLHPGCELRVYPDGGHSLLLTRPADYLAEVSQHLPKAVASS